MEYTENQLNLILRFFQSNKNVDWKKIATKLITDGKCVVAGKEPIWLGGVGNFIKTYFDEQYIDCLVYEFDVNNFMESEMFREAINHYITELQTQKDEINTLYEEITSL